jgi:HD superfamily phosphohydrolase
MAMTQAPGSDWGIGEPARQVRDALYDRIPLTAADLAVIDTPAFLRLDGIQQLGFVSRVWPGARHSRFAHSLGVLHLTRLAVTHLWRKFGDRWFSPLDARTAIAAALLHDVGHYPFSHAIEELGPPVRSHEAVGRRLIEESELAAILGESWQVRPASVAAMIHGDLDELTGGQRVLRGLLSGTLDMDKLDYLPRDAQGCSVPYGGVDTSRLLDSLTIVNVQETDVGNPGPTLAITGKGVSPLHSLINARQEMFDNVYWHHTNRACMVMLLRAVQDSLLAGTLTADSLTGHDDASLMALLQEVRQPESTRRLAGNLARRRIHKRSVEVSARSFELYARLGNLWYDPRARRSVEIDLAHGLSSAIGEPVPDTAVLIDIPKPERWKTDVWVSFEQPPIGFRPLMPWRQVVGLEDADFKRYEEHRRLIRIVTEERFRKAVSARWEQLLLPLLGGAF